MHKIELSAIIFLFFMAMVITGLLNKPGININKLNATYFALIFFIVDGVVLIIKRINVKLAVALFILFLINFMCFGKYYYCNYPQEVYPQWMFYYNI